MGRSRWRCEKTPASLPLLLLPGLQPWPCCCGLSELGRLSWPISAVPPSLLPTASVWRDPASCGDDGNSAKQGGGGMCYSTLNQYLFTFTSYQSGGYLTLFTPIQLVTM